MSFLNHAPSIWRILLGFVAAILVAAASFALFVGVGGVLAGITTWSESLQAIAYFPVVTVMAIPVVVVVYMPLYLIALIVRWTSACHIVGVTFVVHNLLGLYLTKWPLKLTDVMDYVYVMGPSFAAAIGAFAFWMIAHTDFPRLNKNSLLATRVATGLIVGILAIAILVGLLMLGLWLSAS